MANRARAKGPYSMERFGRDVLAMPDALKIKKFNWCGLSMGGMVGQWLGANAPDRVEKLILSNTNSITPIRGRGTTASSSCSEKGLAALVDPQHGALVHQGLPRRARRNRSPA